MIDAGKREGEGGGRGEGRGGVRTSKRRREREGREGERKDKERKEVSVARRGTFTCWPLRVQKYARGAREVYADARYTCSNSGSRKCNDEYR